MINSLKSELATGDQVGRYRLIAELARGGMGIVYLASTRGPVGFNKLLALKQLRPDLVEDSSFLTMFLDEARVAARLSHPNIVQTNDVEQSNGRYFIAMEYLDGRPFSQILKRANTRNGLPLHLSLMVVRDALAALDYAHSFKVEGSSAGVVHRDVSPQNIFVTFDGCAKVIDFGIAKAHDSISETKTGVLKGKVNYMAPEQLLQRAEPRSDVFAMGAVLFEVLIGRRLWSGLGELEIMAHLTRGQIPEVPATLPNVPSVLLEICRRALTPRLEDRFTTAGQMRDAIDEYLWSARITPQSRDVATWMLEEFGAERQSTREAVEAHLASVQDGDHGPLLPLHARGSSTTNTRAVVPDPTHPEELSRQGSLSSAAAAISGRNPFGKLAAGVVLAVMAVGVLVGVGFRGEPPSPAPLPSVETAGAQRASREAREAHAAAPGAVSMIALSVAVSPSSARVLIDGEAMPSNPFLGRFPKDYATHRVKASAPGFVSKERVVSFVDNVLVDLSLDPKAPPALPVAQARRREPAATKRGALAPVELTPPVRAVATVAAPPPAPAPRSSAPADIAPRRASEGPVRRAIDSNNPYGEDQ